MSNDHSELIGLSEELQAVRAEVDYYRERLARALEMVRIKDELITKQVARITYLDGRK